METNPDCVRMALSQCRQNYHSESEAGVNRQVNMELYASYCYQSMVSVSVRPLIRLPVCLCVLSVYLLLCLHAYLLVFLFICLSARFLSPLSGGRVCVCV